MKILKCLYGVDTRNIRIYNLGFHLMWFILCVSHIYEILEIDLPNTFEPRVSTLVWLLLACLFTSLISLIPEHYCRNRDLYKYISLLLGSLIEFIIAYKYVTIYPPLNPMVIVATYLGFWFLGGALFVKQKKVKYGAIN